MTRLRQRNDEEDRGPEMLAYVLIYCAVVIAWPAYYVIGLIASWLP